MENASKALIMAGGVLIALMILGALLLMFNNLSTYQNTNSQTTQEAQIVAFNNQFETYNRDGVRGSELYSLLNKVIDYNRRKTLEGTGWSDEGQKLQYEPMKITFKIDVTTLSADGTNRLFTRQANNTFIVDKNKNTFESSIKPKIDELENKYGADSLVNITTGLSGIFPENPSESQKADAIARFNNASKKISIDSWDDIKLGSEIREDAYTYYEYIQFKRAKFNCTGEQMSNIGRVTELNFEFTGKFN